MSWQVTDSWREAIRAAPSPSFPGLSSRLAAIAIAVPDGARVADIGTDHGILPQALLRAGRVESAIAIDRSAAALVGAEHKLWREIAAGSAQAVVGDGLSGVPPGTVDCAILAGLGGRNTLQIVADAVRLGHRVPRVIVQSLTHHDALRMQMPERGYALVDEWLAAEGDRVFLTMVFERDASAKPPTDPVDHWVGEALLRRGGALLDAWLAVQRAWLGDPKTFQAKPRTERLAAIDRAIELRQSVES